MLSTWDALCSSRLSLETSRGALSSPRGALSSPRGALSSPRHTRSTSRGGMSTPRAGRSTSSVARSVRVPAGRLREALVDTARRSHSAPRDSHSTQRDGHSTPRDSPRYSETVTRHNETVASTRETITRVHDQLCPAKRRAFTSRYPFTSSGVGMPGGVEHQDPRPSQPVDQCVTPGQRLRCGGAHVQIFHPGCGCRCQSLDIGVSRGAPQRQVSRQQALRKLPALWPERGSSRFIEDDEKRAHPHLGAKERDRRAVVGRSQARLQVVHSTRELACAGPPRSAGRSGAVSSKTMRPALSPPRSCVGGEARRSARDPPRLARRCHLACCGHVEGRRPRSGSIRPGTAVLSRSSRLRALERQSTWRISSPTWYGRSRSTPSPPRTRRLPPIRASWRPWRRNSSSPRGVHVRVHVGIGGKLQPLLSRQESERRRVSHAYRTEPPSSAGTG